MGYLNNTSTVLDAVLTKKGRELLAKGSENFEITQFAIAITLYTICYFLTLNFVSPSTTKIQAMLAPAASSISLAVS